MQTLNVRGGGIICYIVSVSVTLHFKKTCFYANQQSLERRLFGFSWPGVNLTESFLHWVGVVLMCLIKPGCFHLASEAPVMKVKNNLKVRRLSLLNIEYRLKPLERPVQIQIFVGVSFAFKHSNFHSCAI